MENKEIKVIDNIRDFCLKYDFKYDNNKYIKHISDNSKIIIKLKDNDIILYIEFNNLKGENPSIVAVEKLSMDSIKSFIYSNSLDITLSKLIIYNIGKIYNKIIFNNENKIIYL